jgi:platelet-activating factor acetylhydrolase
MLFLKYLPLRIGIALDAWMWPLQNELELPKLIEQPILFINMEGFQKPFYLEIMKRFITDKIERRVITLK